MMRLGYISIFILLALGVKGQQIPITSQPLSNAYYYNPAAAGVQAYVDISLGGRQQWIGIENAPRTYFLYANSALGKTSGKDFSYLSLPVSNPAYYKELSEGKPRVKSALGGRLYSDSYGAFSETGFGADYAIHLPLKERLYLSFGLGLEVSNFSFDREKAQVMDQYDPSYDQFLSGKDSEYLVNGRFGVYLYSDKLRLGYSFNQLITNDLTGDANPSTYQGQRVHQFGNASYRFSLKKIGLTPSVATLYTPHAPLNYYTGLILDYDRIFLLSAAYRNQGAMIFGLGFTFAKIVRLSYTYDFPITATQNVSSGSHEILLKVMLNRKKGVHEKK